MGSDRPSTVVAARSGGLVGLLLVAMVVTFQHTRRLHDLPRLNGYEACRRIRELPWGDRVVLIAVTGWGQEDDRMRDSTTTWSSPSTRRA